MKKKKGAKSILTIGLILLTAFALTLVSTPAWAPPPDSDGDGVSNSKDQCPGTPPGEPVDPNGCSASQQDFDGDGVDNATDQCPGTPPGEPVNTVGCPDLDGDGSFANDDCDDTNPAVNPGATEACGDGIDNNCDGNIDEGCGGGAVDTDGDGYTDAAEQAGITLPAGMTLADGATTYLPPCASQNDTSPTCVHYLVKDLFVIVDRATDCPTSYCGESCTPLFNTDTSDPENDSNVPLPSAYPTIYDPYDPLVFVAVPQGGGNSGGLGITVHECLQNSSISTLQAIETHYAVRIRENLDPCGSLLGIATPGLPSPTATATVWTERIKIWIKQSCSEACFDGTCYNPGHVGDGLPLSSFQCKDAISGLPPVNMVVPNPNLDELYYLFIQNVINHELGHLINLATGSEASGYHLPAAEAVVMEQFIGSKATKRGGEGNSYSLYLRRLCGFEQGWIFIEITKMLRVKKLIM